MLKRNWSDKVLSMFAISLILGAPVRAQFVYVTNQISNNVSGYTINGVTGALTPISGSPFNAGSVPFSVAVDPTGKFAYVTNLGASNGIGGGHNVSGYTINGVTGALTPISGSPFTADTLPVSVAVDPTGRFAYVANNVPSNDSVVPSNVRVYTINSLSGALTPIRGSPSAQGSGPVSVAVDPTGKFAYVANGLYGPLDNVAGYTISGVTGALTPVIGSPFGAGSGPSSVTVDPTGKFAYVANSKSNNVSGYAINGVTGTLTPITGSPFAAGSSPGSVAVDPTGKFAYVANSSSNNVSGYTINGVTGALTPLSGSPFAAAGAAISVAVDPAGKFVYVASGANSVLGYAINGITGALAPLSGSPYAAGAAPSSITITGPRSITFPAIVPNPAQVEFDAGSGLPAPSPILVTVTPQPGSPSTIAVTTDQPWLSATPSGIPTGSASNVSISVNPTGLAAGSYHGTVQFNAPNYARSTTAVDLEIANPSAALVPAPGSPFFTGLGLPSSVVIGDFNGDGRPDLAITTRMTFGGVRVLLGNGSGGFTTAPGSFFTTGSQPTSLVAGDFNGDGKLDLAVANGGDNTVTILLGNGLGGFTMGKQFPVDAFPNSIAVADFNGDGAPDLAVANANGNSVTILLGDASGSFNSAPGSPLAVGSALSLAVGDFNGDGRPDLAVAGTAGVRVYLGNGAGQFTAVAGNPFQGSYSVAVGDLNGDGKLDLAVGNGPVLLGDGTGGFTSTGISLPANNSAQSVAVGDIDGDGKVDLAIVNGPNNSLSVFLGNGVGAFTGAPGSPFAVGTSPAAMAVGDLNGDGRPDLVIANSGSSNVTVLLGSSWISTSTMLAALPGSVPIGQPVSLTANVSSVGGAVAFPTSLVRFHDGNTVLGTATLVSGAATFNTVGLLSGPHTFYADYLGDSLTAASTSTGGTVIVTGAQWTVGKTHVGTFKEGQNAATYTITIANTGTLPTSGPGVVTEYVPTGLTLVSMAGLGWTCSGNTCARSEGLVNGFSYPEITSTVNVAAFASLQVTNTVTVSGGGAVSASANDPTNISTAPPFGVIDTPLNGAIGQAGAINFTGWALSGATVANIALCRETLPGEPGMSGLLYLGNAVLTPNARPDVAIAHPGYPNNNWGWGAQILTNTLPGPNGQPMGNGTYRLHAIAADTQAPAATHDSRDCGCTQSYCTDLGTTTISADNAHSILPFGTIDTPGQGQIVSGTDFVNFGWVLTPQPNIVPIDASTIMVYIDNVAVGHPVYNNFRTDIAALFPGLKNSSGGVGYFHIDTTKLSNGIHNIAWGVTDNAGNAQGIGSRAFFVQN